MQGLVINNTNDRINISFDKKIFDENMIANWLKLIEIEYLAHKIDFNEDVSDIAKEIKSKIWKKEKNKLGIK